MKLEKQEDGEMENLLGEIPRTINKQDNTSHGLATDGSFAASAMDDAPGFHGFTQSHHRIYGYSNVAGYANGTGNAYQSPPGLSEASSSSRSGSISPAGEDWRMDELRLLSGIRNMSIGGQPMASSVFGKSQIDTQFFPAAYSNAVKRDTVWGSDKHFALNRGLLDSSVASCRSDSSLPYTDGFSDRYPYNRGLQNEDVLLSMYPHWPSKGYSQSEKTWADPVRSPYRVPSYLGYSFPVVHEQAGLFQDGSTTWLPSSMRNEENIEDFGAENSLIIQGKGLYYEPKGGRMVQIDRLKSGGYSPRTGREDGFVGVTKGYSPRSHSSPIDPVLYEQLMQVQENIYYIAKDQNGCRFLQHKLDEGRPQVDKIFDGIIEHSADLMVDSFGNYLMQKLLDVCNEDQRMDIILVLTQYPDELVRISLNAHGTRAVQKLIETLKSRQQTNLVISALKPGFLELIKDLNGNHVVQRCLQSLSMEDNTFIFDAAAIHCVNIATHRHGCCVLQRCIAHSSGEHRVKLIAVVSANGLILAQDPFGNYVVQFVLELKNPLVIARLAAQFEGNYVLLSTQKFSSNVVEKCLKLFGEDRRAKIILELLSVSRFEQLVQDPYANYVIQSALLHSKGPLHTALVEAIRPHASVLRTNPYSKRILSRTLLKK